MKSAVTVTLLPETVVGPFLFGRNFAAACEQAANLGFDGVEIFPPSAKAIDLIELRSELDKHRLGVAAIGTGAGWLLHQWHLCHRDSAVREQARQFIRAMIDVAAELEAPVIVGSMQGRAEAEISRDTALAWLGEALNELGAYALELGQPLLFEPLNRYETNLLNRLGAAAVFLDSLRTQNVRLLADFFHMNIEEADLADSVRTAASRIGHVHFADSNRQAVGFGHSDLRPAVRALRQIGYHGFLSAEILPVPDAESAARQTLNAFRELTSR